MLLAFLADKRSVLGAMQAHALEAARAYRGRHQFEPFSRCGRPGLGRVERQRPFAVRLRCLRCSSSSCFDVPSAVQGRLLWRGEDAEIEQLAMCTPHLRRVLTTALKDTLEARRIGR